MKKFWILQEFRDENLEQKENEFISKDGLNVSDWDDADNVDEINKENDDLDEEEADDSRTEEAKDDFYWSEICENWINLAEHENQFDNEEDNHLLEMAQNFYAAGRNVHPADDETAKWNLKYLFNENIQAPTFLGIDNNLA
ncbi:hypothetical protein RhiirC2_770300 [Rhizophagus irregularis]|uniref:Uncharacterized protein n=1 Tax=Rhizophagus irregularis TaxID=588596 RepID=A0A2N1NWV4_9GLOM|nr:hypothetical protein RhiirC2_770300 [Rhizophagus irregularis]